MHDGGWSTRAYSFYLLDVLARLLSSVRDLPEKSGIYHFLINFSSGMGEWYMKVVYNSFDS